MSQGRKTKALQLARAGLTGLLQHPATPEGFKVAGNAILEIIERGERDEGEPMNPAGPEWSPLEPEPLLTPIQFQSIIDTFTETIKDQTSDAIRRTSAFERCAAALELIAARMPQT